MSTCNPCDPEEDGWVKPSVHSSKIPYLDISDSELDQDYENLSNSVQRPTHCSSAYCFRQRMAGSIVGLTILLTHVNKLI